MQSANRSAGGTGLALGAGGARRAHEGLERGLFDRRDGDPLAAGVAHAAAEPSPQAAVVGARALREGRLLHQRLLACARLAEGEHAGIVGAGAGGAAHVDAAALREVKVGERVLVDRHHPVDAHALARGAAALGSTSTHWPGPAQASWSTRAARAARAARAPKPPAGSAPCPARRGDHRAPAPRRRERREPERGEPGQPGERGERRGRASQGVERAREKLLHAASLARGAPRSADRDMLDALHRRHHRVRAVLQRLELRRGLRVGVRLRRLLTST
jgi:hypothetical protein